MSVNATLITYFTKVKPINDELGQLLTLLPDSFLNSVDQIFDYLRKKYDYREYIFGQIKFVPASYAVNNDEWELYCQFSDASMSVN